MSNFKIVNNSSEIALNNSWVPSTKFNSKDRLVDAKGTPVSSDYNGHQYRIIEKRERAFSTPERMGRGFLGILAVVCTLFFALFSQSVRNLFTKSKETMRFGICFQPPTSPDKKTPPLPLPQKTEFKIYLEKCKEGVILNSQNLDKALEQFGRYIEDLFKEGYDGFHDGKPGPTYSGRRLFNMFEFSATSRENWQIKLHLGHQYEPCFNPQEEEIALNIVNSYLTSRFKEKIQDIQINHKKIHITWKS